LTVALADMQMRFLGVGGSSGMDLGSAAAVLEVDGEPLLLIDCGQETLQRFQANYGGLPPAVFVTHAHMDHVSGLESLFFAAWFDATGAAPMRLFVPAAIVPLVQQRLVIERSPLAEGGVNFWDAFRLVPVEHGFWWREHWFDVLAVRHHRPGFSFGLRLEGRFVYTGDTRPIPELLAQYAAAGEIVLHDCRPRGNPSHSGWDDLSREYPPELLARVRAYHYGTAAEAEQMQMLGATIVDAGEPVALPAKAVR
jgi:ribonuclease BN (tRNA processing enzyme)